MGQTSSFLCWGEREQVRGRRSGGYQRGVHHEEKRELTRGGHRSDDWDRQREVAGGHGQSRSGPRGEIMGDGGPGGGQKESVRRGRGQREQFIGSGGPTKSQREEVGKEHARDFILSEWVSPGKGAPGLEAAPGSWCGGEQRGGQSGSGAQARKL